MSICFGQKIDHSQFSTKQPLHILDSYLNDISFAFSMRVLESDYNGPLVRLRRDSDNEEMDFGWGDNDIVDINAINIWKGTDNVYLVIWYDQSGLERDAIQIDTGKQPQFYTNASLPHFQGDGSNDFLLVDENFQVLTENGKNGTVLGIFFATDKSQITFGIAGGSERWLTHLNWSNENVYFDPGYCCNSNRNYSNNFPTHATNPGLLGIWGQYTFSRRENALNSSVDQIIMRTNGIEKKNGDFPDNQSCNLTYGFGIGAAAVNSSGGGSSYSTTKFMEMIMYSTGKEDEFLNIVEENQLRFWNL